MTDGPAPTEPTVFLLDDDPGFLRALSRLLRASGFRVVAYSSAVEFLAAVRPTMTGCVITDLMMPGMDGMAVQEALRNAGNPLPMVFLTAHGDIPTTVQAMRGGAEDFLRKTAPKDQLLDAVRRALARGERQRTEQERLRTLQAPFARLTAREREVLTHVLAGQLNKQIADDLAIDERSVKRHRTSLMAKLQVQSVAALVRLVEDAGLRLANTLAQPPVPPDETGPVQG